MPHFSLLIPCRSAWRLLQSLLVLMLLAVGPGVLSQPVVIGSWEHVLTAYGQPKYPRGFSHFDYANPQAPKGGLLRLGNPDRLTSFDKFNPFTVKGSAPTAMLMFVFETLAIASMDEPSTLYGLIAEVMMLAPDQIGRAHV